MRLGIFGGSFDPVHRGHLVLAESCARQAALDEVWFVPAAHQPLKPTGPRASDLDRLAMLRLALDGRSRLQASDLEIERGGVSYTVDTLARVQSRHPEAELFFLMGADSLADLPNWQRPEEICDLATLLVVRRAGEAAPNFNALAQLVSAERLEQFCDHQVEMPETPISSSGIRELIAADGGWEELLPSAVAGYIRQNCLYLASDS
jgi:nicotinate-nucleotide adenylyltransferase